MHFPSFFSRNILVSPSASSGLQAKISDFAIFRPVYAGHYFHTSAKSRSLDPIDFSMGNLNKNEAPGRRSSGVNPVESPSQEMLPLRWVPWEVYIMVSTTPTI